MRVRVLASGSGGNATLFEHEGFTLMVDAGLGPRALQERMRDAGATPRKPDALVVTHAHADHVGSAQSYVERHQVPLWMSAPTARALRMGVGAAAKRFEPRESFQVGPFLVQPCPLPHDVAQVALRVQSPAGSALLATDLGEVPPALLELARGVELLLLESNHDAWMLANGPYPPFLQRRVASARGHLSNAQCAEALRALPASVKTVVLMHLSQKNNTPALALDSAADALSDRAVRLLAASQTDPLTLQLDAPWPSKLAAPQAPPAQRQLALPLFAR